MLGQSRWDLLRVQLVFLHDHSNLQKIFLGQRIEARTRRHIVVVDGLLPDALLGDGVVVVLLAGVTVRLYDPIALTHTPSPYAVPALRLSDIYLLPAVPSKPQRSCLMVRGQRHGGGHVLMLLSSIEKGMTIFSVGGLPL